MEKNRNKRSVREIEKDSKIVAEGQGNGKRWIKPVQSINTVFVSQLVRSRRDASWCDRCVAASC